MYTRPNLKTLLEKANYKNAKLEGGRVLVRSCLNVPLDKEGNITDKTRIQESLPLLRELKSKAKRVVIMAHLGRPEGIDPTQSLKSVKAILEQEIGVKIGLIEDFSLELAETGFYLIENIRFFAGENAKDKDEQIAFANKLAKFGDIFINDAFADYRESPSTYEVAKLLPSYLGPAFYNEVKAFSEFSAPSRPFVAILGGAKLSEKLDALNALANDADKILIGGAMSYTLLKAMDIEIGNSLVEIDKLDVAKKIMERFANKILLPLDHVVVNEFKEPKESSEYEVIDVQAIPQGKVAVDIGPKTVEKYMKEIEQAKSIIWNGPMGVFEWDMVGNETKNIAQAISDNADSYSLAGGGDSIAAINKYGVKGINHISTGGGAMLAFFAYESFGTLDVILDQ